MHGTDAARAFALALRASIESQAQEGGESSADLRKQVASRKRLAKMFVVSGPSLCTRYYSEGDHQIVSYTLQT